jgi:hypothetical protein
MGQRHAFDLGGELGAGIAINPPAILSLPKPVRLWKPALDRRAPRTLLQGNRVKELCSDEAGQDFVIPAGGSTAPG